MIRFLLIFCLFLFQKVEPIKAISYNIRYNNPNDGMNIWENRRETVASLLNEQNADFVGLQEVVYPQLQDLVSALKNYDHIGVGREDGKTKGEYSPIFYKKEKYKLLESNTFWLSESPETVSKGWDAMLERICTYGLFQNRISQEKIWVFNTHFDHRGVLARAQSIDLITQKVKELNQENLPLIITGDFNLTPDQAPIQKMQSDFEDVQKNLPVSDPYYATSNNFDTDKNSKKRIDYIFIKDLKVLSARHLYKKTPMGGWASDHHPVMVLLKK
ncbi:endonuclease/exonuclease/phosphatase family protein [Flavobacteriaceae bacterium]|nr:endonuclease/exonuclease/phosphatase family protein [Flavobacteriaceae bacterium]